MRPWAIILSILTLIIYLAIFISLFILANTNRFRRIYMEKRFNFIWKHTDLYQDNRNCLHRKDKNACSLLKVKKCCECPFYEKTNGKKKLL